jgi:hypothetical protein
MESRSGWGIVDLSRADLEYPEEPYEPLPVWGHR